MYHVMIVDDEPVIRFGLKASVDWEQEGLVLVGDYPNGEEAVKQMEVSQVDILITDIKMPVMDGLTLMKRGLQLFPNLKVILVSSYNDFDYVREGLKYGAVDYVLKPTLEPEEFTQLIRKCVDLLKEEDDIKSKLAIVEQNHQMQERKEVEAELRQILLQEKSISEYKNNLHWMNNELLIINALMNNVDEIEENYGVIYKSLILEDIQEQYYSNVDGGICLIVGESELVFIMKSNDKPVRLINRLFESVIEQSEVSFSFGYEVVSDLQDINLGYKHSHAAIQQRFYYPEQRVFAYSEADTRKSKRLNKEQLKQYLLPMDEQKVVQFIDERAKLWEQEEIDPFEVKQEASDILTYLYVEQLDLSLLLDKCQELIKAESLMELVRLLKIHIDDCAQLLRDKHDQHFSDNELMESALDYIHQHYTDKLTLQDVADHIHISRNYFSILFKRYSEKKFIDYLISLRIKKASELLVNTSFKVYEVAKNSGFNDVKYFSKLFKKMTGYSPIDYRSKHQ